MLDQTHAHTDSLVIVCVNIYIIYIQIPPEELCHGPCGSCGPAAWCCFCQEQYGSGQGEDYWSTGQAMGPLGTIGDHWGPMKPAHGLTIPIHPDC